MLTQIANYTHIYGISLQS